MPEDKLSDQKAFHVVDKKLFKSVPETYYLATPYLQAVRHKRNWSLRDMAERAGVSVNYYHDFERGRVRAGLVFINKISSALTGKEAKRDR